MTICGSPYLPNEMCPITKTVKRDRGSVVGFLRLQVTSFSLWAERVWHLHHHTFGDVRQSSQLNSVLKALVVRHPCEIIDVHGSGFCNTKEIALLLCCQRGSQVKLLGGLIRREYMSFAVRSAGFPIDVLCRQRHTDEGGKIAECCSRTRNLTHSRQTVSRQQDPRKQIPRRRKQVEPHDIVMRTQDS